MRSPSSGQRRPMAPSGRPAPPWELFWLGGREVQALQEQKNGSGFDPGGGDRGARLWEQALPRPNAVLYC